MLGIERTIQNGIEAVCPHQCAYCRKFIYLNGMDDLGVCEAHYDEWQDRIRNQTSCCEALSWFGDNLVHDDYECDNGEFEEN